MKTKISILLLLVSVLSVLAQDPIPVESRNLELNQAMRTDYIDDISLESIFRDNYFALEQLGPMRWLPDGKSYSVVERNEDGNQQIIRVDIKTGDKTILVDPQVLVYNGKKVNVESYTFTEDLSNVLIFSNSKRLWRYNTIGEFYLLDIPAGKMVKVAPDADPSSLQFAKLSPDGKYVGYVYKQNLYIQSILTGAVEQLTFDGTSLIINGTFDWAYEEEFGCRDGFRWSPDGKKIAFWRIDSRETGVFNMINYTDSIYSKLIPIPYPKVGTAMSSAKIGVITVDTKDMKWMDIKGNPAANYLPYMGWADSNDELFIQQVPRKQTKNNIIIADVNTGDCEIIYTDDTKDKYWVDVNNNIQWFDDGKYFLWLSEQDGWNHIYLISRDGKDKKLITRGDYDVMSINYIDTKKGYVYFTSSLTDPTMRFLYSIKTDGKSQPKKIGAEFENGTHSYNIAPSAQYAIHNYSSAGVPSASNLVDLKRNKTVRKLVTNDILKEKLEAVSLSKQEFFKVDIAPGVELDAWIIKPNDFDPNKKYPTIFYIYGEPVGVTVTDSWGGATYLFHQYLADQGYVVISVENRGTPSPRGVDFRKYIYKEIGIKAPADQSMAVLKLIETMPFIDGKRIGVWGWSGGGSMTLNALLKYPEIYKVGVSIAPVPDQKLYDSFYQERYMLEPDDNQQGYYNGSPVNFAKNLEGKLLLIHGTGDDNCHYQGTERMINELIKHQKQFTMFAYPNRSHGIYEGENTSIHLRKLMYEYFRDNL